MNKYQKNSAFGREAFNNKRMSIRIADVIYVQNFTLSVYQAKNFTLQMCVICDIFPRELTA